MEMAIVKTANHQEMLRGGLLLRFAVLVPHRDIRPALRAYRRRLFAAGIRGAYSFPPVVPLARLTRPLREPELKALAAALRALSLEAGPAFLTNAGGGPVTGSFHNANGSFSLSFWGLPLNIPAPPLPSPAQAPSFSPGLLPFPQMALCAAVAGPELEAEREILRTLDAPPDLRFHAAATANLAIKFYGGTVEDGEKTLPGLSSRWIIGKPCWLPRPRRE
jgi:hypothetical protein